MGYREAFEGKKRIDESIPHRGTICSHAFSDLSHVPPPMFVYLVKKCYLSGTHKATQKFRVLQQHVSQAIANSPKPCPSTFVIQCMYVLPLLGHEYTEGFSHLLLSSLWRLKKTPGSTNSFDEKHRASRLFLDILANISTYEERILIKVLEVFDIKLEDIAEAINTAEFLDEALLKAKEILACYILEFIESRSYMTAVTLMERFSIHLSCESLLERMVEDHQYKAAEKWAEYKGKPSICFVVKKYLDKKMLKQAFAIVKKNNLNLEFPDVYYLYKESSLKKFAEKGCWDLAEQRTNKNKRLLEYLVYLAMEAGYMEKVDELCERYSLQGFARFNTAESATLGSRYLDVKKLVLGDIIWVDKTNELFDAVLFLEGCRIVGVDSEWKPNYEKGSKPNKVSIMQIASENRIYIFDMIKLYEDCPGDLNKCFERILCSSNILKLGYNLQCDLHQLSLSYGDLECFRNCEMFLDIQKLFRERSGGLSGLAEKILGAGLNKTRRNSNWEQRPLSQNQLEYAALDAAVLLHILSRVREKPTYTQHEAGRAGWKSHIVFHVGDGGRKSSEH